MVRPGSHMAVASDNGEHNCVSFMSLCRNL